MLMSSKLVHVFNPEHSLVYQDMKQPLSHYYVASSHNTYLLGNQLTGMSSVEAYIIALQKGCRCVELDCWDGEDGEPIIYHGYTLTSKIRFRDVISDAIKPYAFQYSEYPLILSIENHCSVRQQDKMAAHLKSILGDMLFTTPVDESLAALPSPEFFRRKVLVKAKKLPADREKVGLEALKQKVDDLLAPGEKPPRPVSETEECTVEESETDNSDPEDDEPGTEPNGDVRTEKHRHHHHGKGKKKKPISPALSVLVNYVKAVHFHSFEESANTGRWWTMSSFGESKATAFVDNETSALADYNKRQLSRIYPSGKRQDSSNLNPVPFWNTGCQIVALNYQTPGKPTSYNQGMFRRNGGCGYVLKPAYLRSSQPPLASDQRQTLRLRIISGAYIPKPPGSSLDDIIDPYVCVYVTGVEESKFKTAVVKNNGFNPMWDEELTIAVRQPEFCLLDLVVRDHSTTGSNYVLGHYCLHYSDLTPGYRYVPLEDLEGNLLGPASLFVHIEMVQPPAKDMDQKEP